MIKSLKAAIYYIYIYIYIAERRRANLNSSQSAINFLRIGGLS